MLTQYRALVCYLVGALALVTGMSAAVGGSLTGAAIGLGVGFGLVWFGRRLQLRQADDNTRVRREKKFRRRLWRDHWQTGAALVGVNVAAFYLCNVNLGFAWSTASSDALLRWGAIFPPLAAHGQAWRFLTATFLHVDAMHLVGNMIALFLVSRYVDYLLGPTQTVLIYAVTGVTAGLAEAAVEPMMICVGASGAIMGLEGIFLAALLFGRPDGKRLALSKLASAYLIYHALSRVCEGFGQVGIANAAHVAGLVAGFGIYLAILRFGLSERRLAPGLVAATFTAFVACQITVFNAVPSASEGLSQLAWRDNMKQLLGTYDRFHEVMSDLDRLMQNGKAQRLNEREYIQRVKTRIVPRLDAVYAELGAFKPASPAIREAQSALYYHVGYTRQSLQLALDNQVEGQTRAMAAAKAYGGKVSEAFANMAGGSRAPASVPL